MKLVIVVPCYNEEEVLPVTSVQFLNKLEFLIQEKGISSASKILFVDDGSRDKTWNIIVQLSTQNRHFCGIRQSRNRGHQNAVLAGLMEAKDKCDITISIDCDGQDDINAMDKMVDEYLKGNEIVYGVRNRFIMDLGVSRKYTVKVVRVNPKDYDDGSSDESRWSNGKWYGEFRDMFDVWQNFCIGSGTKDDKAGGYTFTFTPGDGNRRYDLPEHIRRGAEDDDLTPSPGGSHVRGIT